MPGLKIVDKRLKRHTRPPEDRNSTEDVRITMNRRFVLSDSPAHIYPGYSNAGNGSVTITTWAPPTTPAPSSLILLVLGLVSLGTFLAFSRRRVRA
jgi:hypothetical protein